MPPSDRLESIVRFLETLDQFKSVYRAAYLGDHSRHESDAEHTWHVCMFALLLYQETDIPLNIQHVLELALTHDLVEIYAGDTFVHLTPDREKAREREEEAAGQLFGQLPADLGKRLHGWWHEFEDGESEEARFARAIDRLHGFAQNLFARGRVWRERQVTEAMTRTVNQEAIELHPILSQIYEALYARAAKEGLWDVSEEGSAE